MDEETHTRLRRKIHENVVGPHPGSEMNQRSEGLKAARFRLYTDGGHDYFREVIQAVFATNLAVCIQIKEEERHG